MGAINEQASRRKIMQGNKGQNTRPELKVRKMLHGLGARYRLYRKDLPGRPDIVMPGRRVCIFVHGCFWHQHENCHLSSNPRKNVEFWKAKFEATRVRDAQRQERLKQMGWKVVVIWECEVGRPAELRERLERILENYPLIDRQH